MSQRDQLVEFFRDLAEVWERHGEVAEGFVLTEVDGPPDEQTAAEVSRSRSGIAPFEEAAEQVLSLRAAARARVCIRFGFDPKRGRRCIEYADIPG